MEKQNSILISFFRFLTKPNYGIEVSRQKIRSKLWDVIRIWALFLTIAIVVGIFINIVLSIFEYDEQRHAVVDLLLNQPLYLVLLLSLVWAPLAEELTFRMGLKYSPFRLSFSIAFILIIFFGLLTEVWHGFAVLLPEWIFSITQIWGIISFVFFIMVVGLLLGFLFRKKVKKEKIEKFYLKKFNYIFYSAAFVFALLHLFNFLDFEQIWFLAPLIILPQFILGLILGFVRMKFGLGWAIANHLIHNAVLVTPVILIGLLSDEFQAAIETQNFDIISNPQPQDSIIVFFLGIGSVIIGMFVLISIISLIWQAVMSRKSV